MSEEARPTSSGTAEAVEEALLRGQDPGDVRGLRSRVPGIELKGAAKQDAVCAGKHVAEIAECRVSDLGLWLEDRELTTHRLQLLVAEQVAAAKAGAIEHEGFRQ